MSFIKLPVKLFQISIRGLSSQPQRTCLYDVHIKNGGKMVDFGGWNMPVQYADMSIAQSTLHTREHASVFDVSHMLQTKIYGKDRVSFIESLTPSDICGLPADCGTLSVFLNESGGILDDLIITNTSGDHLYLVTNAGCIENDVKHMQDHATEWRAKGKDVIVESLHGRGLIALQGPKSAEILQKGVKDSLDNLYFMRSRILNVFGIENCRVTRCGYTGEDGFEISVDSSDCPKLANILLSESDNVKLAGLGARDALRLEAGMCLYGNDISPTTTPVNAALTWLVAKKRRESADFPGSSIILSQIESKKVDIKRIGLVSNAGRVPRKESLILDEGGNKIGVITSGCPSPCLHKNIAMGYISMEKSKIGTNVFIDIGGKGKGLVDAIISKMPFVKTKYHVPPK